MPGAVPPGHNPGSEPVPAVTVETLTPVPVLSIVRVHRDVT